MKILNYIKKILLSFTLLFSLSSCNIFKSDDDIIEENVNNFITCLENKDKDQLKKLFAKNKIKDISNFDDSIDQLFNYYEGEFVSKDKFTTTKYTDKHYEFRTTNYEYPCDINTTKKIYRLYFNWYIEYSTDKDMIGIWSFYILKKEDDTYPNYTYWGDGLNTPGINIGKIFKI